MAAKVVMVAVPTVLGVASIRVYRVRDAPADGITREKLTIYSPLEQSTQVQFVREKPGLIESGFSATREAVLPFVQAVKGVCVSVKRGSVNLYNTGQDVYYYLKDPPPDFIPRFGTITMAGLLGMFLARKGSRAKRVALPLGLMSAGASVCYPAEAVALFKVTGKKVYAAGQWSSGALSSLFTPKAEEHVAKEIVASQSQVATGPAVVEEVVSGSNPVSESNASKDSSAQSSTIPEADVECAESVPVQVEEAIVTLEESSVTLMDQAPPDTNTESVVNSVASETETSPPSEELPVPVESEKPLDSTQTPEDVSTKASPAEPMPDSGPDTAEPGPTEAVPSTEEPSAAPDQPAEAVAESAGPESAVEPPVVPVEETSTLTPPPPEQPTAEDNNEVLVESSEPELAVEPPVVPVEEPSTLTPPPAEQPTDDNKETVAKSAEPELAAEPPVVPVEEPPTVRPPPPEQPEAEDNKEAVVESVEPELAVEPPLAPTEEPSTLTPPPAEQPTDDNKEAVVKPPEPEPEPEPESPVAPVEEPAVLTPPPEQPAAEDNKETVVESAEAEPVAPVEETSTLPPPPPEQPAAEDNKGGSGFKPDPAFMDFGQASPEDQDLYTTRS